MNSVRISIQGTRDHPGIMREVEELIGHNWYQQGTDATLFVDFTRRDSIDLAVVNLNCIPGVKAEIVEHA